jgi:RimJ/RimL family protein N-acetyltransferase
LRIDEDLYDRIEETYSAVLRLFWPERQAFISEGLGYCLVHREQIASVCFTAFVGAGECDISLSTSRDFRGRGYATLTTTALIEAWLAKGLSPQWHTTPDNAASIAIASKMGFEETGEFLMYDIRRRDEGT